MCSTIQEDFNMYKILIWGTGLIYGHNLSLLQYFEHKNMFKIVAVTSNEYYLSKLDGYPFVPKKELHSLSFDYCIVALDNINQILDEATQLGIPSNKLIPISVLSTPLFDFDKYIAIKESPPTIISPNCFAGLCYHQFGLQFKSPTINMFFRDDEYLPFISNIHHYLQLPLEYIQDGYDPITKHSYPICRLGDLYPHFNHYMTFENAYAKWNTRKERINWSNIIYTAYAVNPTMEQDYHSLSLEKKYIFVPHSPTHPESIHMPYDSSLYSHYGLALNQIASYTNNQIDLLALLNRQKNILRTL